MSDPSVKQLLDRHPMAQALLGMSDLPQWHVVGGAVREALLGLQVDDLDITVADEGEALAKRLAEASHGRLVRLGGDRFASYRVVAAHGQADVWDRKGGTLRADLERRDLTVNSIACALHTGAFIDPFGGCADLADRLLRATRLDCFQRDALRVLRLARFRVALTGSKIEPDTARAAGVAAPKLSSLATERIRDELGRTLSEGSAHPALAALEEVGALTVLLGEAAEGLRAQLLSRAKALDEYVSRTERAVPRPPWSNEDRLIVAVALLLTTGAPAAAPATGAALEQRGIATRTVVRAALHAVSGGLPAGDQARRLFLAEHGSAWPRALAVRAAVERVDLEAALEIDGQLDKTAREHPDLLGGPTPFLDGHRAARLLGLEPGPQVGAALAELARAQVLGRVNSRSEAEEFLRAKAASGTPSGDPLSEERATSPRPPDAD